MKRIVIFAAVALLMFSSFAFAQDPELRGTWKGTFAALDSDGVVKGDVAYVIKKQTGSLFEGTKLWFSKKNVLKKVNFRGIYDNGEITIAEAGNGYSAGYLTAKQQMVIKYFEAGSSYKAIINKLERVHFTTGFVEIDKDGNKIIMRAEITNHYPLNAERILKEADKNGDGKLTKKEWEDWKKANDWE